MQNIRTGIYETKIIRKQKEIIISRENLEKKIMEIEKTIQSRIPLKKENPNYYTNKNIDSLKRIKQTGQMLLNGCSAKSIAHYFGLKDSTIKSYIFYLK